MAPLDGLSFCVVGDHIARVCRFFSRRLSRNKENVGAAMAKSGVFPEEVFVITKCVSSEMAPKSAANASGQYRGASLTDVACMLNASPGPYRKRHLRKGAAA